jgi:murein DD-endopeptidase MepM/ murein hydrolase activator NlpD
LSRVPSAPGVGRFTLLVAAVALLVLLALGVRLASTAAPTIELAQRPAGIGRNTLVTFKVRDPKYRIKSVQLEVTQNGRTYNVPVQLGQVQTPGHHWWQRRPESVVGVGVFVGRKSIPELEAGRATLHIAATNDSWGRFFRGGRTDVAFDLPVRFSPPLVEVLSPQHYINQGGSELVIFKVSPGTVDSGVQVGNYFFPSWPAKEPDPLTRLGLFAFPYDVDATTAIRIVARDDAGNETVTNFNYKVFPKKFHTDTINLTDEFMQRVVPPIMSQMPDLDDQGSLLKNFLMINGHLRQVEAQQLIEYSKQSTPRFLWTEPFIQLGDTKVEAHFADYRTYVYNGQVVDHQTHLGFDLAGLQHMPVKAANDGVVVFAQFFGIFGNAVLIDHGCGLMTLYGHMSSLAVKAGDSVKRGQQIGVSGETGLAGGDHLHFTVLLDGIPVSPVEWWDPHWIHDRIEAKMQGLGAKG